MKILTIISLVLALLAERTTALDEARKNELMGNIMKNINGKLKNIRQYCKQDSNGDIHTLENIADNLESSLANDQLSILSSKGGMTGSLMVAASFIPSPFSAPLFYYGGYLTTASTVAHASNVAFRALNEEIDERELHSVLGRVHDLHVNIQIYEDTLELFNMFEEGAKLFAEGRHATFSGVEPEIILEKLLHIDNIASSIFERKKVNLWEFAHLCKTIYEYLEFFTGLGWNQDKRERLEGSIRELTKDSKYEVQEVRRDTGRPAGSDGKSAFTGGLQTIGSKWSSALGGFTSVLNIYSEAANIKSTEELIRNKKKMIRELRKIAEHVWRVCRKSEFCSM